MSHNPYNGQMSVELSGTPYTLVLNLGALAHLEQAFGAQDLTSLVHRFEGGQFSASDLIKILAAALRGGGATLTDAQVAQLTHPQGLSGLVQVVRELLLITFAPQTQPPNTPLSDALPSSPPSARPS